MRELSNSSSETERIGYRLGSFLKAGDVIAIYGNLGAGKTTLIKGIGKAFGMDERDIISPSFTIIAEYPTNPVLCHIDLYRVDSQDSLFSIGFWEHIRSDCITLIEWADKAGEEIPKQGIKIRIQIIDSSKRSIDIEGLHEINWHNL